MFANKIKKEIKHSGRWRGEWRELNEWISYWDIVVRRKHLWWWHIVDYHIRTYIRTSACMYLQCNCKNWTFSLFPKQCQYSLTMFHITMYLNFSLTLMKWMCILGAHIKSRTGEWLLSFFHIALCWGITRSNLTHINMFFLWTC